MLLKNINNLIVELGMLGLQMFMIDLRRDLLEKQSDKFKGKAKKIIEIFNQFIDEIVVKDISNQNRYAHYVAEQRVEEQKRLHGLQDLEYKHRILANQEISGKVYQLINILEKEYSHNSQLKAIIFVKDRSVATYLKKILDFMFKKMSVKVQEEDNKSFMSDNQSIIQEMHNTAFDQIDVDMDDEQSQLLQSQYSLLNKFRCNFAIGFQGKSLTNKAYRSTKSIEDEVQQMEEFMPQFSHVKMTHQNLMKNIEDFKNDKINILIATSVIEEGLDVSTCNLVISINEVLNVKSFIQTKGRARQKNSKFIFLCANEEREIVERTIESFKALILNIQEIAYSNGEKVILPDPNVVYHKQKHDWQYIITQQPFEAKCTMREAPTIFDLLCNEIIDGLSNSTIKESELVPQGLVMTSEEEKLMKQFDLKRQKRRVVTINEERKIDKNYNVFSCKLILPEYLKYYFYDTGGAIISDRDFPKKKEAENYVFLLAVKRMYAYGLFGDDLYPNLSRVISQKYFDQQSQPIQQLPKQPNQPKQPQKQSSVPNVNASEFRPSKKFDQAKLLQAQIVDKTTKAEVSKQLMQAKQELQSQKELFTKESKKSSLPVPVHSVYIDKSLKTEQKVKMQEEVKAQRPQDKDDVQMEGCSVPQVQYELLEQQRQKASKLYLLILKGVRSSVDEPIETQSSFQLRRKFHDKDLQLDLDDSYPYKNISENVGILWDQDLSSEQYKLFIELQQENRQKHKNSYYLEKLSELNLITEEQKDKFIQLSDILEMRIESIEVDINKVPDTVQKLQFFHFWFYYFVNNANFRFYKILLKGNTSYSQLFSGVVKFLKKAALKQREKIQTDFLKNMFNINAEEDQKNNEYAEEEPEIGTYLVPVNEIHVPGSKSIFKINWKLINELLDFVRSDLLNFCLSDNHSRFSVSEAYGLFDQPSGNLDLSKAHNFLQKSIRNVWSCDSNQNLFIVMSAVNCEDKIYKTEHQFIGQNRKQLDNLVKASIKSSLLTNEIENDQYWYYKHISIHNHHYKSYISSSINMSMNQSRSSSANFMNNPQSRGTLMLKSENQTIAEHYFAKTGVYLSRKDNNYLFKCSKERCLLDFSVQKSTLINNQAEESKSGFNKSQVALNQQSSTLFDVPQQLMKLLPIKYEQYQMLQLSNFFYASLLEIVKVENFINKFLTDLRVHTEDPMHTLNLQQWDLTPRLYQLSQSSSSLEPQTEPLSSFIKRDFMILVEAMTAPTANKPIDYERLEFYGDSVISFLVILELFLTTATRERTYKEGELDFYRIKAVSNMNLAQINEKYKIYEYIITDSTKVIADELQPPGFDNIEYHQKIKAKTMNEMKSKLLYLKKCEVVLKERIHKDTVVKKEHIVDSEYVEMVRMLILQQDLFQSLSMCQFFEDAWNVYTYERSKPIITQQRNIVRCEGNSDFIWRVSESWLYDLGITIDSLRLCIVQVNIDRIENKYRKEKSKKEYQVKQQVINAQLGKGKNKKKGGTGVQSDGKVNQKLRHFQPKQLADTVESITGAIANSAGLFSAQDFLNKLEVLKYDTFKYELELNTFVHVNFNGAGYQNLMLKYSDRFDELQEIIGYKFKNPCLLVQAMTHKSFKENFNTMKEHQMSQQDMRIDDYERLEFLGDSILNFLIAQYYFMKTKDKPQDYQPKQLHKLKTSVVNNVFLSLVVVQRGIHNFVLYNQNSEQFKKQFDQYVEVVIGILQQARQIEDEMEDQSISVHSLNGDEEMKGVDEQRTKKKTLSEKLSSEEFLNLKIEPLYEHSLKIFGDVFESLIGAIFLDSKSITATENILYSLLKPFLKNHTHVESLDDHSRTKLLELWNSKTYTRNFKIRHEVDQKADGSSVFKGHVGRVEVRKITFLKDMKNKVRRFYNDFYDFIEAFVKHYEQNYGNDPQFVDRELRDYRKKYQPPQRDSAGNLINASH